MRHISKLVTMAEFVFVTVVMCIVWVIVFAISQF